MSRTERVTVPVTDPQNLIWVMPAEGYVSTDSICIVFIGGLGAPEAPLPQADLVIAADSGYAMARQLGFDVDLLVGDLDSIEDADLNTALRSGVPVEQHPVDKDVTDLTLALEAARTRGAGRVIVVGGGGIDRLDHVLANAGVVAADAFASLAPEWWLGASRAYPVRDERTIEGTIGDRVSLIPMAGVPRVTTSGLRWVLDAEELPLGSSRGVSNEMTAATATVGVTGGVVMVVHGGGPS